MTNEELNELVKQDIQWEYDPAVHNLKVGGALQPEKQVESMTQKEKEEFFNSPDFQWPYNPEDRRKAGLPIKPLKDSSLGTTRKQSNKTDTEDCLEIRQKYEEDPYLFSMLAAETHHSLDDSSSSSACIDYDSGLDCGSDY